MKELNIWNWSLYGMPIWMSRLYLVVMFTIWAGGFTVIGISEGMF